MMNLLRCTKRPFTGFYSKLPQKRPSMRNIEGTSNHVAVIRGLFSRQVISILKPPSQFIYNPSIEFIELHTKIIKMEVATVAVIDATNNKFTLKNGLLSVRMLPDHEFTNFESPSEIEDKIKSTFSQCLLNEMIHVSIQSYLKSDGINVSEFFINKLNLRIKKLGYELFSVRLPLDVAPPTSLLYEIYVK